MYETTAERLIERWKKLTAAKSNWESLWEEVATYVLPSRKGFTTKKTPGSYRGQGVYDSTAIHANHMLASHMHSALTSPATPWFSLRYGTDELNSDDKSLEWLDACSSRMYAAFSDSNFSTQASELYNDLVALGTGAMFIEAATQEPDFKLQFHSLHLGSICCAENADGIVDTIYHKRKMSARQAVQRWEKAEELDKIKDAMERNPDKEFSFLHCVSPNPDWQPDAAIPEPKYRRFKSYWVAIDDKEILEENGYYESPYVIPRWSKVVGDIYGYGPGIMARADIRTINEAKRMELAAYEKAIDPPLLASATGVISDVHLESGGLTFVRDMNALAPLMQATQWQATQIKSEELRNNILSIFLIDQLSFGPQKTNTTATEMELRYAMMNRVLGPTSGRLQQEFLNPLIERVFGIMYRTGQFEAAPDTVGSDNVTVEYQGPLARNQRYEDAQAIERLFGVAAQWAQMVPNALDIIDVNGAIRILAERYGVPSKALKGEGEVEEAQQQRVQKQAEAEQMQMEAAMAQTNATQASGMKDAAAAAELGGVM